MEESVCAPDRNPGDPHGFDPSKERLAKSEALRQPKSPMESASALCYIFSYNKEIP
jgi:hypothetical protein